MPYMTLVLTKKRTKVYTKIKVLFTKRDISS